MDDIFNLEKLNKSNKEKILRQEEELLGLRSNKIENEARISYQDERIRSLTMENDLRGRQFDEVEAKLIQARELIEEKNLTIKDAD